MNDQRIWERLKWRCATPLAGESSQKTFDLKAGVRSDSIDFGTRPGVTLGFWESMKIASKLSQYRNPSLHCFDLC